VVGREFVCTEQKRKGARVERELVAVFPSPLSFLTPSYHSHCSPAKAAQSKTSVKTTTSLIIVLPCVPWREGLLKLKEHIREPISHRSLVFSL
jgi:hypothetical protein